MTTSGSTPQAADADWPGEYVSSRVNAQQVVRASYESSTITFEKYAEQAIRFAESSSERARRELTQRRLDILRDAWGPLLVTALNNWLVNDETRALILGQNDDHVDLSRNPAKHIWQELAVLYKLPPKRSTQVDGVATDDDEKYTALLEPTDFDIWWQLVELLLNACNEVVIWPDVIERNGKKLIKHRVSTGANLTAIPIAADNSEIECWVIIDEYKDTAEKSHKKYRIWTADWHGEFERGKDGKLSRTDRIDPDVVTEEMDDPSTDYTVANPYGEIPMIRIRLNPWPDTVWDQTSGEDLVDLNIHGGINRQFFRYLEKVAGFKQGVLAGDIENYEKIILDPGFVIKLEGENTRFTVVDWEVDLGDRLRCMDVDEQAAAAAKGINPQRYKRETDYQTGANAKNAERGLAEYRERNKPIMLRAEREYYPMLCNVTAAHGIEAERIPNPDAKLNVDYQPLAFPSDPLKQLDVDSKEIGLGLESHKTILKRKHPDWTVEQINQHLKDVMEAIAYVNDMKTKHQIPNKPENESADAEEDGAKGPVVRDDQRTPPGSLPGDQQREE